MVFIDTNILIKVLNGEVAYNIKNKQITSTIAKEFLFFYEYPYYIKVPSCHFPFPFKYKRSFNKKTCTNISSCLKIFNKKNEDKIAHEYCDTAIAKAINDQRIDIFSIAISALNKKKQREIKDRIMFLLANNIKCKPIDKRIALSADKLFREYNKNIHIKDNILNEWRDMLIISSVARFKGVLITNDKKVSCISKQYCAAKIKVLKNKTYEITY